MGIIIKAVEYDSADYHGIWQLREEVLRTPLGLTLADEDLSTEKQEHIFALFLDEQLAACVILKPFSASTIKLRQMAVADAYQGKKLGQELLAFAEQFAKEQGYEKIELHARDVALGFYQKSGYEIIGDGFTEVNIPHHKMFKQLK